jgi:hypothetical protein
MLILVCCMMEHGNNRADDVNGAKKKLPGTKGAKGAFNQKRQQALR